MRASATRSMWAERGAHVGALIGGILSVTLSWIPRAIRAVAKYIWENREGCIFLTVFVSCVILPSFFIGRHDDWLSESVTKERFAEEFSKPDRACIRDWVPRVIANSNAPVTNKDLNFYIETCDKNNALFRAVNQQKIDLQEQMKFINEGKP